MIDVGARTWHERRKGQKRKTVKREGRGWEEKEGNEKRGVGASKGKGRDGRQGRGIGKRKGKGRADVGEGYTTLRAVVFILHLHIPNLMMWLREPCINETLKNKNRADADQI